MQEDDSDGDDYNEDEADEAVDNGDDARERELLTIIVKNNGTMVTIILVIDIMVLVLLR